MTSSLVEGGVGTGWTVLQCLDMQFKNRAQCEEVLKKEKTTHDGKMVKYLISYVTMFLTRAQFARVNTISPSETENENFRWDHTHKCTKSDNNNKFNFEQWFVGFTDGDGCFNVYINKINKKIKFTFKLSQKNNNIQVLHYMKKSLGVGVVREDKRGMAHFLIRDKVILKNIIIPLFDKNFLLTSKEYNYQQFKRCIEISDSTTLTQEQKINLMDKLLSVQIPDTFIPSIWHKNKTPITKDWLVGFVEAEGSFYIVKKGDGRYVHGFGITQKKDNILLKGIVNHLGVTCTVKFNIKGFYAFDVMDSNSLKTLKIYFFNTMKGVKSLDYRIWARSFRDKGKNENMQKVQTLLRDIRKDPTKFETELEDKNQIKE